jgi:hypothetical protein
MKLWVVFLLEVLNTKKVKLAIEHIFLNLVVQKCRRFQIRALKSFGGVNEMLCCWLQFINSASYRKFRV